jgi:hypothetical protein
MLPPTTHLPPIRDVASRSPLILLDALRYIRGIYIPEVRGSRRRRQHSVSDPAELESLHDIIREGSLDADALRSDRFERAYVVRWLTAVIGSCVSCEPDIQSCVAKDGIEAPPANDNASTVTSDGLKDQETRERLLGEGASLLAICAGTASAGSFTRHFVFGPRHSCGTHESRQADEDAVVKVQLTDVPLENEDYSSVGAQTWGAACVLAEMIVDDPPTFLGCSPHVGDGRSESSNVPLRVLELGAGTGLVSLVVGKLLQLHGREARVVATDFHPSVLKNLQANISTNFSKAEEGLPSNHPALERVTLSCCAFDWSRLVVTSPTCGNGIDAIEMPPPLDQPFDVVLGADIIYEAQHAEWIKSCLDRLLRRPTPSDLTAQPYFHLIIPLRSTHVVESQTIEQVFPRSATRGYPCEDLIDPHMLTLGILEKEIVVCDAGDDQNPQDEVQYARYRIGWVKTNVELLDASPQAAS